MQKGTKTSALLLGASLLLTMPTLPTLADGVTLSPPTVGADYYNPQNAKPYPMPGYDPSIPQDPKPYPMPGTGDPSIPQDAKPYPMPGYDPGSSSSFDPGSSSSSRSSTQKGECRKVKVGVTFTITLKENTSSGYEWSYTTTSSTALKQIGVSGSASNPKGTATKDTDKTWTFLACKSGTYTFKFSYTCDGRVAKTQTYTIEITK